MVDSLPVKTRGFVKKEKPVWPHMFFACFRRRDERVYLGAAAVCGFGRRHCVVGARQRGGEERAGKEKRPEERTQSPPVSHKDPFQDAEEKTSSLVLTTFSRKCKPPHQAMALLLFCHLFSVSVGFRRKSDIPLPSLCKSKMKPLLVQGASPLTKRWLCSYFAPDRGEREPYCGKSTRTCFFVCKQNEAIVGAGGKPATKKQRNNAARHHNPSRLFWARIGIEILRD